MVIDITRMAGIMLVFGFFFFSSCSTTSIQLLHQAEAEMENEDYESALASVNNVLDDTPRSEEALLLKAEILFEFARTLDLPGRRFDYYREMRTSLDDLGSGLTDQQNEKRNNLVASAWSLEQGMGVRILQQSGSNRQNRNYQTVIAHFENALTINPDSSSTYNLQATTYYENGEVTSAIETLNRAGEHISPLPVELIEKQAFLYLEDGQIDRSVNLYRDLYNQYPDNNEVIHGLINAYILGDNHTESVSLLRDLIRMYPSNIMYHEALATELFYLAQSKIDELALPEMSDEDAEILISQIFQDLNEAEEHYSEVRENHPDPIEITFVFASFYKNTAANLLNLADKANDPLSELLIEKANELLQSSIPLWISIAESNPENPDIWLSIYQVYNQLGMEEEAASVRPRTNL